MKPRILAFAVALAVASDAGASILSASSQAARQPSIPAAGMRDATTIQHDLNGSLRDAAADVPAGALSGTARTEEASGGLLIGRRSAQSTYRPFSYSTPSEGLFDHGGEEAGYMPWRPDGSQSSNKGNSNGGFGRRDRGNPHATPEPSTWLLVGSGLLLLGAYAGLRRRAEFSA